MSRKATVYGLGSRRIIWNPDFQASRDDKNLWTGSVSFTCHMNDLTSLIPDLGSACQEQGWSFMYMNGTEVANNEGDTAVVTCKYTGLQSAEYEGGGFDPNAVGVYTKGLNISTVSEPVETLKKYRDNLSLLEKQYVAEFKEGKLKISKVVASKITQLVTQVDDLETRFIEVPDNSEFQELLTVINDGVEEVLVPKPVYTYSYNSRSEPTSSELNDVGKVSNNPPRAPSVGGGRNWLLQGITFDYDPSIRIYKITQEWLLSGEGGWDERIYENA